MFLECDELEPRLLYRLLIGSVVPRPIAWISSSSKSGVLNLAPFSFFNALSANPPIVGIGIGSVRVTTDSGVTETSFKDSYANIVETGEFVVNIVSRELAEKMVHSSGEFNSSIDEFKETGLSPEPSKLVACPRVREAKVSMECSLFKTIDLGASNLVLGRILCFHVDDSIYNDGYIDAVGLAPVARLGGEDYCYVDEVFSIARPEVAIEKGRRRAD